MDDKPLFRQMVVKVFIPALNQEFVIPTVVNNQYTGIVEFTLVDDGKEVMKRRVSADVNRKGRIVLSGE